MFGRLSPFLYTKASSQGCLTLFVCLSNVGKFHPLSEPRQPLSLQWLRVLRHEGRRLKSIWTRRECGYKSQPLTDEIHSGPISGAVKASVLCRLPCPQVYLYDSVGGGG